MLVEEETTQRIERGADDLEQRALRAHRLILRRSFGDILTDRADQAIVTLLVAQARELRDCAIILRADITDRSAALTRVWTAVSPSEDPSRVERLMVMELLTPGSGIAAARAGRVLS